MSHRLLYSLIPALLFIGGAIAFAANNTPPQVVFQDALTDSLFIGSSSLRSTTVTFTSNIDLRGASLYSSCDISSKLFSQQLNQYIFALRYNDATCSSDVISVVDVQGNLIAGSQTKLNVYSNFDLYNTFTDYSSSDLKKILWSINSKIKKTEIFTNKENQDSASKFDFYAKKVRHYQYLYNADIIEDILAYREHKYIVPVKWKNLSNKESHLPNALRLYRSSYTDGIHHGWDVPGEKWEQTIALDQGIITRVVDNFTQANFDTIVYGDNLSNQQKLENLDVLRWNQVWLKTMKGDYVFYSHLGDVFVEVWDIVFAGDPIGTIDVTGVPGDDYHDYHLHFPIHPNPYNSQRVGSYEYSEIMWWPWYFKGKSIPYVREHQSDVFK